MADGAAEREAKRLRIAEEAVNSEKDAAKGLSGRRVAVTGAKGFLGQHLVAQLKSEGAHVLPVLHADYDLLEQSAVRRLYAELRPEVVIHAAGAVGGLGANVANPGRFLYENAMMGLMLLDEGRKFGILKFVLVSTVCVYPESAGKDEGGVMREEMIWEGFPNPSISSYGLSKRLLHEAFRTYHKQYGLASSTLVLTNLYGPNDHFGEGGHMVPMVVARYCDAAHGGLASVTNWGTGKAVRDWVYVGDAARAICLAAASEAEALCDGTPINIGSGAGNTVAELCQICQKLSGFTGEALLRRVESGTVAELQSGGILGGGLEFLPAVLQLEKEQVTDAFGQLVRSKSPPLSVTELLTELHHMNKPSENIVPVKFSMQGLNIMFGMREKFDSKVYGIVIQSLVEEPGPLPTLFMRTVIQVVKELPRLSDFIVMEILPRLLRQEVWGDENMWRGFMIVLQHTFTSQPGGAARVLAMLPSSHLEDILVQHPDWKAQLVEFVARQPPGTVPPHVRQLLQ